MKKSPIYIALVVSFISTMVVAQTPAEVKLVEPFEEDRGWCLDLRGSQQNAAPIGGIHGHTCYTYQGNGVAIDQGFFVEGVHEKNEFRMSGFPELCMTLYEPRAGSFISIETCDDRPTQDFVLDEKGKIISEMVPDLCLTIGDLSLPGGGGRPLHILREATFEKCGSVAAEFQTWELRSEWTGLAEATLERTWEPGAPNQAGNGAMGMGMAAPVN